MDALIHALAGIESVAGEKITAAPNPTSCRVCNDCEGWESERVAPKGRTFVVERWPSPGFEIKTNIRTLIDSANAGCPTCEVFRCAITKFLPEVEADFEVTAWLPMPPHSLPMLWVKPKGVRDDEDGFKFDFFTTPDAPAPWTIFRPGKLFPEDTSSSASLQQTLKWLQDCLETHPQCQISSNSEADLPTRILDVDPPGPQASQMRLYETKGETGLYVALSHCWGRSPMLKTERGSLNLRRRNIPWDIIPRTFQDAITFVRRLGLRYLWIDSLCIIQDDRADWERESAKMASIYTNAVLTIAATKSADSEGGCFSVVPESGRTHKITGLDQGGRPFTIYARPSVRNWEKSPLRLYSRAWCFQERILSPRVLHFHHHELKWECQSLTTCESSLTPTSHDKQKQASGPGLESDPHSMNDKWRKMVQEYVELDLTYASDRLPAFSGLAKHIQQAYGRGRYLAGLWDDSLLEDLMWWVREEDTQNTWRPKEWRAPSWSWASREGRILHRILPIKTPHCEIVEVEITPAGIDLTGAVASGRLVISGILAPAILRHLRPKSDAEDMEPDNRRFGIEVRGMNGVELHKVYIDYELDKKGPSYVADGQDVRCLCIATDQWHKCWLVLRRMQNMHADVYERIGMAWQSPAQEWATQVCEKTVVTIM